MWLLAGKCQAFPQTFRRTFGAEARFTAGARAAKIPKPGAKTPTKSMEMPEDPLFRLGNLQEVVFFLRFKMDHVPVNASFHPFRMDFTQFSGENLWGFRVSQDFSNASPSPSCSIEPSIPTEAKD